MARLTVFFGLMLILSCGKICSSALTTCSSALATCALEDIRQEFELRLEAKIEAIEEQVAQLGAQLEEKVAQLVAQLEPINNELRQDLTLIQLEVKTQDQERRLTSMLEVAELPVKKEISMRSTGRSEIPRTCRELHLVDPSLSSGMHWIDPDGQGVGDDPINVYCDVTSGSTSILHDSESSLNVGHCSEAGCYSRSINYNSSIGQIKALMELSTECHQSIRYDCQLAPFESNGVAYSWWNDREGNARYIWAGSNVDGVHSCQCGMDESCYLPWRNCNCDVVDCVVVNEWFEPVQLVPFQLVDDGVITDKNVLPVTRLNFGGTQNEISSGVHTLGRLVCTGSIMLEEEIVASL